MSHNKHKLNYEVKSTTTTKQKTKQMNIKTKYKSLLESIIRQKTTNNVFDFVLCFPSDSGQVVCP